MSVRSVRHSSLTFGRGKSRFASTDRDATAFLEVAGIFASHQQKAIYELVRLLKQYGLWTKMKAIYPFVGGTATTHKWNLKDPQDTDAAYRLTFNGGWTHSDTGALPNGLNTWANTYFANNTQGANDFALSYYSRTNNTNDDAVDMGGASPGDPASMICFQFSLGANYGSLSRINTSFASQLYSPADSLGLMSASSTVANQSVVYHKGIKRFTNTNTTSSAGVRYIYIGAGNYTSSNVNNGTAQYFTTKQCAFASISAGLTDSEQESLHWAVDKYQRLLSRNV